MHLNDILQPVPQPLALYWSRGTYVTIKPFPPPGIYCWNIENYKVNAYSYRHGCLSNGGFRAITLHHIRESVVAYRCLLPTPLLDLERLGNLRNFYAEYVFNFVSGTLSSVCNNLKIDYAKHIHLRRVTTYCILQVRRAYENSYTSNENRQCYEKYEIRQ